MNCTIKRDELLLRLAQVTPAIDVNRANAAGVVHGNVLLSVLDGRSLQLACASRVADLRTRGTLEQGSGADAITVSAKKLQRLAALLPSPALTIASGTADSMVTVKAGRSRYRLRTLPAAWFPNPAKLAPPDATLRIAAGDLQRCVVQARTALDPHREGTPYGGMLLDVVGGGFSCVATDGHRLAIARCQAVPPASHHTQAIVAARAVQTLLDILANLEADAQVQIDIAANAQADKQGPDRAGIRYLRLRVGDCVADFLLVAGLYPDYKAAMPSNIAGQTTVSREALLGAAERAQIIFAPDRAGAVDLAAREHECTVEVQRVFDDQTRSTILSETLDAQGDAWPVHVRVNVGHLVDALRVLDAETVMLQVAEGGGALQIEEADNPTSTQILVAQPAP